MTRLCPATVLVVEGDAEHMTVDSIAIVSDGVLMPPETADLSELRRRIQCWTDWALCNPAVRHERQAPPGLGTARECAGANDEIPS